MPRFVHLSDTHLGYQAYGRLTPDGLNQREVDAYDAFERVVDWCLENRPDFVVHSGDVFDSPRPSNRAIASALAQVRRLSASGIPLVLLSGNHDAPRLRETGHIFRIFEELPHVHPVYRGVAEVLRPEAAEGGVLVHAVPQAVTQEALQEELNRVVPVEGQLNILVVHGTVSGVDGLFTTELNDLLIPQNVLEEPFDYVALGHFHGHRRITDRAFYAGSTERTSIAEAGQDKSFSVVDMGPGKLVVATRSTRPRPMVDVGPIDARGLDATVLAARVEQALSSQACEGAVVRLVVKDVSRATLAGLDVEALMANAAGALHVQFRPLVAMDDHEVQATAPLGHIGGEFEAFLQRFPLDGVDRDEVRREALRLLAVSKEANVAS